MAAYLSSERRSMLKELRTADVVDVIATVRQIRIARCSALSTQKSTGDYSHGKANCPRDVWMRVDLDFHGTSFVGGIVRNRRKHTDNQMEQRSENSIWIFLRPLAMAVDSSAPRQYNWSRRRSAAVLRRHLTRPMACRLTERHAMCGTTIACLEDTLYP